jgi:hypothetical protein
MSIRLKQCAKCPWRKDVDPRDIPNGYCEVKHANLASTIAKPGVLDLNLNVMRLMACHESNVEGEEEPCVGWMHNQLGPGNNLGLRLWFSLKTSKGEVKGPLKVMGEQHQKFEDTLPKEVTDT